MNLRARHALNQLVAGNERFAADQMSRPRADRHRRLETAHRQNPSAAVLTCADSRVSPELLFDQGLGDLFVVRSAGLAVDDLVRGALEYAVGQLDVPLVVVLGHSDCGAMAAAALHLSSPRQLSPGLAAIVAQLAPAAQAATVAGITDLSTAILDQVRRIRDHLRDAPPVLSRATAAGQVEVLGAHYDCGSGIVGWLDPQ